MIGQIEFPAPAADLNGHDLDVMARTIFGEARGEQYRGQVAVAWVILNRAAAAAQYTRKTGKAHKLFGNGRVASVCKAPLQFSCWNTGDPTYEAVTAANLDQLALRRAHFVALASAFGFERDPTLGSLHYHTLAVQPAWSRGRSPAAIIGGHKFFNDIP